MYYFTAIATSCSYKQNYLQNYFSLKVSFLRLCNARSILSTNGLPSIVDLMTKRKYIIKVTTKEQKKRPFNLD